MLWFFQMGVIYFWVIDDSPDQVRTARLLALAARSVVFLIQGVRAASDAALAEESPATDRDRDLMVTFEDVTVMRASIERCFDLFCFAAPLPLWGAWLKSPSCAATCRPFLASGMLSSRK